MNRQLVLLWPIIAYFATSKPAKLHLTNIEEKKVVCALHCRLLGAELQCFAVAYDLPMTVGFPNENNPAEATMMPYDIDIRSTPK